MKRWALLFCFGIVGMVSCKKHRPDDQPVRTASYSKVVILGNSILYSPESPALGWPGSWGMAASAANKDYVHILTGKFKALNAACQVNILNIAQFEREFTTYDLDANLNQLRSIQPDLLIIRIGENVATGFDATTFNTRYLALINYFKATNPSLKVYAAGSFWTGKDAVDAIMAKHSAFTQLSILGTDMSNYAWGQFTDPGIASHPNDKGMKAIADMMWTDIAKL